MVIYHLLSTSHLFTAVESFTLLLHWSLALPSFEFNTIFLIFTDNLTLSTASGFCDCVYKLCLLTESFAVGQKTAYAETIIARLHIIWRFRETGSPIQISVCVTRSDVSIIFMNCHTMVFSSKNIPINSTFAVVSHHFHHKVLLFCKNTAIKYHAKIKLGIQVLSRSNLN